MNFKEEFAKLLQNAFLDSTNLDLENIINNITRPPSIDLGNYCYPVFVLSKSYKLPPNEIAKQILENLNKQEQNIFKFSFVSGYINATIEDFVFTKEIIAKVLENGTNYGKVTNPKKTEYVIDTFNVNPLKALHIGHLRNAVTGQAISKLLEYTGDLPIAVSYGGDVGTHVAKFYWYYTKFLENKTIPKEDLSRWFGNIYISATKLLSEKPEYKEEIDLIQSKLLVDEKLKEEIKVLANYSKKANQKIAEELNLNLKENIYESQSESKFLEIKDKLFSDHKEIFTESDGAIICDLSDYKLGVLVLIKNNNAPLYASKDIGLVKIKQELFPTANNFLYVVGSEQEHYFKQLFKLFSFIYPNTNHQHISHGLVNLTSGKMASREGGSVLYEDFRDSLNKKTKSILEENNLEIDQDIIDAISFGTIKFEMLKVNLNKTIVFDINKALDLNGDSAVYIQYTGVRAKSIFKKSEEDVSLKDLELLTNTPLEKEEKILLNLLSLLKEKIVLARKDYRPSVIANYLLDLSHAFNKFYSSCQVLHTDKNIKLKRLLITKAYIITLNNACDILGIKIPERM
jgi:arginyl-tRNA synthetase